MDIQLSRTEVDGKLIFTFEISNPAKIEISDQEKALMDILEGGMQKIEDEIDDNNEIKSNCLKSLHFTKEGIFLRLLNNLKSDIRSGMVSKFNEMFNEIYNWSVDSQSGDVKMWMQEFDPLRQKFYFNNDLTTFFNEEAQESEHDGD